MEEKFITQLKEILEIGNRDLNLTDNFRELDEWSSLANLSVMAMIDEEYDVVFESSEFNKIKTIGELIAEIKSRIS